MRFFLSCILMLIGLFPFFSFANDNVVNVYTWSQEIPHSVIKQFQTETGIKVNYTAFDSNEAMYAKLRTNKHIGYDVIEPSSYYIDRMRQEGMLEKLDKTKLPNFVHLDPFFTNLSYDPHSQYSIPYIWGVTGIFINKNYFSAEKLSQVNHWSTFLDKNYVNQLMLLDDAREVFSMALRMLGYSVNDSNPAHIKEAYLKLKELISNVRLFNTDAVISILIDEDAYIGMAWNGDLFKASLENPNLAFVYPKEGFEIWIDNFAIVKQAPHLENAYKFLNFMLRPDIAKIVSMSINYSTANLAALNLMPSAIKNNDILYPPHQLLLKGEVQKDIGKQASSLFENYWEQLKMEG